MKKSSCSYTINRKAYKGKLLLVFIALCLHLIACGHQEDDIRLMDATVKEYVDNCFVELEPIAMESRLFDEHKKSIEKLVSICVHSMKDSGPLTESKFSRSEVYTSDVNNVLHDLVNYHFDAKFKNGDVKRFIVTIIKIDKDWRVYGFVYD